MCTEVIEPDHLDPSRPRKKARQCIGDFLPLIFTHSPIQALPNELLSNIFLLATHTQDRSDSTSSPIRISHVCRRWRQVASSNGDLWTNLTLTFPTSTPQMVRTVVWLSRSKAYNLDLLLDFRDPSWDWDEASHSFRWQDMESVLRLLLPHAARWRRVAILTDTWAPMFTFLWYTRRIESAPNLESLSLSRCNGYFASKGEIFQPTSLKGAIPLFGGCVLDNLREVSLVGVHVDWTNSRLCNLVELEFKYHAGDVMPSLEEFVAILTACPDLECLTILGWGPRLNVGFSGPGGHRVEGFESWAKLQRSIRLPRLTKFTFGFLDVDYAVDLLSLFYLPALQELSIEDVAAMLNPGESVGAAAMFEYLTSNHRSVCPSTSHSAACCATAAFPLSRIRTLEIRGVRACENSLFSFFCELTSLQRISLVNTHGDDLRALVPRSMPSHAEQSHVPCPALSDLSCRNVDSGLLLETVLSRTRDNSLSPLKKVLVDMSDGDGFGSSDADYARLAEAEGFLFVSSDDYMT